MPEVINVRTYGAVGNNRTDDTAAFQTALDDAASAYNGNGKVVIPPGGTYLVGPLTQRGNSTFTGDGWGSRLRLKPNSNGYCLSGHNLRVVGNFNSIDGNSFFQLNNSSLAEGVTETSGQGNTYVGNIT